MGERHLGSISFDGFGLPDKYLIQSVSRFTGKKISIIGDSIDTFYGYIPDGYVSYYPNNSFDVTSVSDCWWKKLFDISNATLEVNASYSGGMVTNTYNRVSLYARASIIGSPDTILVTCGTNDAYYSVPLGTYDFDTVYTSLSEATFRTAYIKGVKALKSLYPNADIVCVAKRMAYEYKESIKKIAEMLSAQFIDSSNYYAPDNTGVHPNKFGMDQIASSVLCLNTLDFNILSDNTKIDVTSVYLPRIQTHKGWNANMSGAADTNNRNGLFQLQHNEKYDILVTAPSGIKLSINHFDSLQTGQSHWLRNDGWHTEGQVIIPAGSYWGMLVAKIDDSATDTSTHAGVKFYVLMPPNKTDITTDDYAVGPDFVKRRVNVEQIVGAKIYGSQSFCRYNGYYFSANDLHKLWKQDENFNIITEKTIDLGHANGFQLGNSNIAYVWGWDDSKIYCLNLDTMEIDRTITLSLTGYTTGAVDEVRNLAYIFQRDSYPTTLEYYNFIVYDLASNQVVSSRKTIDKFLGMQSCDFYKDRLFIMSGQEQSRNGTTEGYKIYDTSGNLITQYYINKIMNTLGENREIEGVWIDRENDDIYISVGYWEWDHAKLFKITS